MEPIVTNGLVIKETNYSDYHKILTVLTKEHGKLSVIAYGARRNKSPQKSAAQFLAYAQYELVFSKSMYRMQQSELIRPFYTISSDLTRLCYATYFAELSNYFVPEGEDCEAVLRLLLNSLFMLQEKKKPPLLVKAVFELRLMILSGYMPDLSSCSGCSADGGVFFLAPESGVVYCEKCRAHHGLIPMEPLDTGVLAVMRFLSECEEERIFSFQVSDAVLQRFSEICEKYAQTVFGDHIRSLRFLKQMCMGNMDENV